MKSFVIPLIFIILIPLTSLYAQWEVGAAFSRKNTIPQNGAGIQINRNLPFQSPDLGVKAGISYNYFFNQELDNKVSERYSHDLNLVITGEYFLPDFQPFAGISGGLEYIKTNRHGDYRFIFSALAGIQYMLQNIKPFIQASVTTGSYEADIDGFQLRGTVGLLIEL